MARLPSPGGDNGTWGTILNDFLGQAHNSDGSLKDTGVVAAKYVKPPGGIPESDLDSSVQSKLNVASAASAISFSPTGTISASNVQAAIAEVAGEAIQTSAKGAASGVASLDSSTHVPRAQRPDLDVFNVKDPPYNAVGDGVTDDTAAINAAIDAAGAAGGGTVFLPGGQYKITARLTVDTDNIQIRGVGPGSVLQVRAAVICVYALSCDNIVLADFSIESADTYGQTNAGLVQLNNVIGFSVERLYIHNTPALVNGIAVAGADALPDGSAKSIGRIIGCHLHNLGKTPLYASTGAHGVEIDGNYIHDLPISVVASAGIQVLGGHGTRVTNNIIERVQEGGILVQAGGNWPTFEDVPWDTLVSGNYIRDPINGGSGIYVNATLFPSDGNAQNGRIVVTNNDIQGCDYGINVRQIENVLVANNICHENRTSSNSGSGFVIRNVRNGIVANNLGYNNGRDGIVVQDTNHCTIIGNRFAVDSDSGDGTQDRGIEFLGTNSDLTVAFNFFEGGVAAISGSGLTGANLTAYGNTPTTIDVSANLSVTDYVAIGTAPSQTGALRLDNAKYVSARNAAGTTDISLFRLNASDQLQFLPAGGVINLAGSGGINIALDTTTGTKLGTSTANKLGFWGAVPGVQPSSGTDMRQALTTMGLLAGPLVPLSVSAGGSSAYAKVGGSLFDHFTDVSVGGAETDIYSDTLPASLFTATGDKAAAVYSGTFVTVGTEAVQLKVYLAGTAIWDSASVTPTTGTNSWQVNVELIRSNSSSLKYSVTLIATGITGFTACAVGTLSGLTLTATNILKITGTSSGTASGAGDIVGKMGSVVFKPIA